MSIASETPRTAPDASDGAEQRVDGPRRPAASGGPGPARAFALGAVCVSALALAFSLGRHWPIAVRGGPAPDGASLDEVRGRGAIPFVELEVDSGTIGTNASPAAAPQRAKQKTQRVPSHSTGT